MDLETLKRFCSRDITRTQIQEPWSAGEYSFATDGRILIRVPRLNRVPDNKDAPKPDRLFADFPHNGNFLPIPDLPEPQDEPCAECQGSGKTLEMCNQCNGDGRVLCSMCEDGKIECESCDGTGLGEKSGEISCEYCDGSGKYPVRQKVPVGNQVVDAKFLRLIKDLPHVRIANSQKEVGALSFVFVGGDGLIMPIST